MGLEFQAVRSARQPQGDRNKLPVFQQPTPRQVGRARGLLPPRGQFAQDGEIPPRQGRRRADAQVGLGGGFFLLDGRIVEAGPFLVQPRFDAGRARAVAQPGGGLRQMAHVVGRVFEHLRRERAGDPVGARVRLGKVHIEQFGQQVAERQGGTKAGETRGQPRVEHIARRGPRGTPQYHQVLGRIVQDLDDAGIGQDFPERRQVAERHGIDQEGCAAGQADLEQAQPGVVGAVPHEFGVERQARRPAEPRDQAAQRFRGCDQLEGFRHAAAP